MPCVDERARRPSESTPCLTEGKLVTGKLHLQPGDRALRRQQLLTVTLLNGLGMRCLTRGVAPDPDKEKPGHDGAAEKGRQGQEQCSAQRGRRTAARQATEPPAPSALNRRHVHR